mgnify:CR=1 FL=1
MQGLTTDKAKELLTVYGPNVLAKQKDKSFFQVLVDQLNNFLTILLLVAAVLSFVIGEPLDGWLITSIVILNALFGVYQEYKASKAIAALADLTVTKVRVLRDGTESEIDSHLLVPGDIIFIEEGVKIPADGVVLESINLEINEAALTGESFGVAKKKSDQSYMGTIVTRGRGYLSITATGMQTGFGKIAGKLANIESVKSPLQKKLEIVTKSIGIVGIIASIIVFFLATFQGSEYFAAFLLAISLAVAVVPQALPAVMTITLSLAVKEMAKKKAIIRKLTAIEALGSITLIATDKTGTLTTNKMKVKEIYINGHVHHETKTAKQSVTFEELLHNSILCSTATLSPKESGKGFDVVGDPTEGALLLLAEENGLLSEAVRDEWKLIEEIPFDSVSKRMSVKVKKDEELRTYTKGAPESILDLCEKIIIDDSEVKLTKEKREDIEKNLALWADHGLRVLAFSFKNEHGRNLENQTFLGMTAIYDAPRPEIKDAISRANSAGISVVMVTGDNEKTAAAIALESGLMKKDDMVLTGEQLDVMSDEELLKILPKVKVFARVTPFHKHHIVTLHQKRGEIVAVTGDGVNDAIALKQADVGIAMGKVGTDVARETADMVITDDNFATIVVAIEEGRNIIKNLRNAIAYLLSCNATEAVSLIIGILIGYPHIFYPIQFLYINLVTDGIPALSLSFSPREPNLMHRKPEKKLQLLGNFYVRYILVIGLFASGLVIGTYLWFNRISPELANTAAFSVLALIQSFIFVDVWLTQRNLVTNLSKLISPVFMLAFVLPFIAQYAIVTVPSLERIFRVSTVSFVQYSQFVGIASCILIFLTIVKPLLRDKTMLSSS